MAWCMEHRRDVPGGDIRACTASGSCRGPESASGSQGVWSFAGDGTEDAAVRGAARLPATAADQATEERLSVSLHFEVEVARAAEHGVARDDHTRGAEQDSPDRGDRGCGCAEFDVGYEQIGAAIG